MLWDIVAQNGNLSNLRKMEPILLTSTRNEQETREVFSHEHNAPYRPIREYKKVACGRVFIVALCGRREILCLENQDGS